MATNMAPAEFFQAYKDKSPKAMAMLGHPTSPAQMKSSPPPACMVTEEQEMAYDEWLKRYVREHHGIPITEEDWAEFREIKDYGRPTGADYHDWREKYGIPHPSDRKPSALDRAVPDAPGGAKGPVDASALRVGLERPLT